MTDPAAAGAAIFAALLILTIGGLAAWGLYCYLRKCREESEGGRRRW